MNVASDDEEKNEIDAPRKNKKTRKSVQHSDSKGPQIKRSAIAHFEHFENIESNNKQIAQESPQPQGIKNISNEQTVERPRYSDM